MRRLVLQQPLFTRQAAAEADQATVGADDPVAGHDDGDRVAVVGHADGPRRVGLADAAGQLAVADRLAVGDLRQRVPHPPLELAAGRRQRQREGLALAGEVGPQLGAGGRQGVVVAAPVGRRRTVVAEREADQRAVAGGQAQRADRAGQLDQIGVGELPDELLTGFSTRSAAIATAIIFGFLACVLR